MTIDLKGKKALVGAATDGIGKAIAVELSKAGCSVTIAARNEQKLTGLLSGLDTSQQQQHRYLVVDYNDFSTNKKVYDEYFRHHTVDILVNNTNGPAAGPILAQTTDDYQVAFDLLFQNTVYLTRLTVAGMTEKKFGRIINVASSSVKEPIANLSGSSTMRTAVVSWMKTLSKSVALDGITVNSILTGLFDTERLASLVRNNAGQQVPEETARQQLLASLPMQRVGRPEEYAWLVCFLTSDFAGYLSGTTIPLDGGASNYV